MKSVHLSWPSTFLSSFDLKRLCPGRAGGVGNSGTHPTPSPYLRDAWNGRAFLWKRLMESLRLDSQILPLVDSSQLRLGVGREGVCARKILAIGV